MKQKEIEILNKYFYHKAAHLHNDVVDFSNRYNLRNCDVVDHLESIIALTREECFTEIMNEVFGLLGISEDFSLFDNL